MRARHIGQRGPSRRDTMRPHGPQTQRWPHGRNAWSRRARRQTQQGAPANSSASVSGLIGSCGCRRRDRRRLRAPGGAAGRPARVLARATGAAGAGAATGAGAGGATGAGARDRWRRRRRGLSWNKSGDAALLRLARHDVAAHAERAAREV